MAALNRKFGNVLVTGGCGFIGSNFIRHYLGAHPEVRVVNLDLLTYAGNPENLSDVVAGPAARRYRFVKADVCDRAAVDALLSEERFDLIVHFAAESHVDRAIFSDVDFVRTNIEGTRSLVEVARKHKVGRFVHISTDEVYGSVEKGLAAEDAPLLPSNPYAASKAGIDLILQAYMKTHALPATIVRGSNNYGPFQYPEKLIPLAVTNLIEGKKVPIHGQGAHVRSWLHVEDFARAIDLIAHAAPDRSIYNVSGEERTNLDVLRQICGKLGVDLEARKDYITDRPGADARYAPDSSKLSKELGWRRRHRFEDSLQGVVQWYLDHPDWWRAIRLKRGFSDHYERQSKGLWC